MTSSDERREVARKLREEGKIWESSRPDPGCYYNRISRCLGNPGLTFDHLADLIDPTGSLVLTTDGSAISRNCPNCGDPIEHKVNYCPNCGIRLVS